ncbi:MAG: DNA-formamidopyrimidine glycosylase [Bacilli bacterium]|nr:DNA-formamidopyrimidine glycosylase [Bacilli bacterium]
MPELPEVETVKETLKRQVLNKRIVSVIVYYDNLIEYPSVSDFKKNIVNQSINDIERRGKWLVFVLDDYFLLSHLRMEGKYLIRNINDDVCKHEHISFVFDDSSVLRYRDTRKFGRMHLIRKSDIDFVGPLKDLGLEPWDDMLDCNYLRDKYKGKRLPIKTVLLDQSIVVGIGNIYADEILFLCRINPLRVCSSLSDDELNRIIFNTRNVLSAAIKAGGTTIRSYTSSEGVHGSFQQSLLVHNRCDNCDVCGQKIIKIKVGGRGTYYCPSCQRDI